MLSGSDSSGEESDNEKKPAAKKIRKKPGRPSNVTQAIVDPDPSVVPAAAGLPTIDEDSALMEPAIASGGNSDLDDSDDDALTPKEASLLPSHEIVPASPPTDAESSEEDPDEEEAAGDDAEEEEAEQEEDEDDDEEDSVAAAERRKAAGRQRSAKCRHKQNVGMPLGVMSKQNWLNYCDDTVQAKRSTILCVDANKTRLPPKEPGHPWADHEVSVPQAFFSIPNEFVQSRYCMIEKSGILDPKKAATFLENKGKFELNLATDEGAAQMAHWEATLEPLYLGVPTYQEAVPGIRSEPFWGAKVNCWNHLCMPYIFQCARINARNSGSRGRMGFRSVRLTNVNSVYKSRHSIVRKAALLYLC